MLIRAIQRSKLLPVLLFLVLAVAAAAIGYATAGESDSTASTRGDRNSPGYVRGVIQEVSAANLTLAVGAERRTLRLSQSTPVESLQPITLSAVRSGDWLNVGAVGHSQTLFAITGLIVIPQTNLKAP